MRMIRLVLCLTALFFATGTLLGQAGATGTILGGSRIPLGWSFPTLQ